MIRKSVRIQSGRTVGNRKQRIGLLEIRCQKTGASGPSENRYSNSFDTKRPNSMTTASSSFISGGKAIGIGISSLRHLFQRTDGMPGFHVGQGHAMCGTETVQNPLLTYNEIFK